MAYDYDPENVFAKILRGEIPNDTVLETEHSLAFRDIAPQTPTHVLVIPKGPYVSYDHFALEATEAEIVDFTRTIGAICKMMGVQPSEGGGGFRMISNAGEDAIQEVPHLHFHILAGRPLGRILTPA
ncbi:HIT domain-containing protein [Actibacterium ureilyticum]|uniref:HIT domain-containing protein n=1 Tax=Actibacterium ureilyticum TaxID=1590614 RepID=UPI000BAAF608|nr:HIT domain-containing protein [Actibacterium ureilyticum]